MPATLARQLLPQKQRLRLLQDELLALQGEVRIAKGIQVIHCASCGHHDCGQPPPTVLPEDALVVMLGCRLEAPLQATPRAIAEATGPGAAPATPQQQAIYEQLLAKTKPDPRLTLIPIQR
jgi:hypothetical protein